jgi:hypothetical protein
MYGFIQWPFRNEPDLLQEITGDGHQPQPTQTDKEPQSEPSQPIMPDLETVRTHLKEILSEFQCANISANLTDDGNLFVTGFVSSFDDLDKIRLEMNRLEDVVNFNEDLQVHPWPFCEMLDLLQRHQILDVLPSQPSHLEVNKIDRRYRRGDFLVVTVTVDSAFDGYLYVDYLDSDGTVVHMLPSPKRLQNAVHTGQRVVIGAEGPDPRDYYSYEIGPPYGPGLLVAITSRQPLIEIPRRHTEKAAEYFPVLRTAFEKNISGDAPANVTASFLYIEIYE